MLEYAIVAVIAGCMGFATKALMSISDETMLCDRLTQAYREIAELNRKLDEARVARANRHHHR